MHDVAWHHEMNCVRSKDAQKQLARTSLNTISTQFVQSAELCLKIIPAPSQYHSIAVWTSPFQYYFHLYIIPTPLLTYHLNITPTNLGVIPNAFEHHFCIIRSSFCQFNIIRTPLTCTSFQYYLVVFPLSFQQNHLDIILKPLKHHSSRIWKSFQHNANTPAPFGHHSSIWKSF